MSLTYQIVQVLIEAARQQINQGGDDQNQPIGEMPSEERERGDDATDRS